MTLPRHVPEPGTSSGGGRRPRTREPLLLFGAAAAVYLLAGAVMIHFNIVFNDGLSRVGNAYYVLFSRDPHLGAIGFVWNPLPSLSVLPLLPLKSLFPALVTHGAAGVIQSALSMAGAVAVLSSCLRKLGVRRKPRWILVALFGLQPMIVFYAGIGMSEAMLLLFLMLTTSALISWMQHREPGQLVAAGIVLGLAYLARYEAGALAVAVTALVAAVTVLSASGRPADRLSLAFNDAVLVAAPFLFTFFLWAGVAKVLIGMWFPQFSSQYGNSEQVSKGAEGIQGATGTGLLEVSGYLARQSLALAPLLAVLLLVTVVLMIRRRNPLPLVPIVVCGSVSAFSGLVLLMGASFGWFRFQIAVIPLTVLLAGALIGMLFPQTADRKVGSIDPRDGRGAPIVATGAVLLAVALAIPVQARVMVDPTLNIAREEAPTLGSLFYPDRPTSDPRLLQTFGAEQKIAAWIDREDPGEGTVLADSAYAYPIIMNSAEPQQFVITSDYDFQSRLEDPHEQGIEYILVQADRSADAVQIRWPTIFADGAGLGNLVTSWDTPQGEWRLYAVD
ncbi:hypothetical protein [uncultured Kocuria sp.]|uniref:hypothetical protein n=1 Tax=uncultured Kocuria sp. TaxID=259305 RepID=UPI0026375D93|nr:hypothetical protein [uncultured Kocuria sp.]